MSTVVGSCPLHEVLEMRHHLFLDIMKGCKNFTLCINQASDSVFSCPCLYHAVKEFCALISCLQPSYTRLLSIKFLLYASQFDPSLFCLSCSCKVVRRWVQQCHVLAYTHLFVSLLGSSWQIPIMRFV